MSAPQPAHPASLTKDALQGLNLGNSVAEFDESLEQYFIENEAFRALVRGEADVIAGDKGTGKTAIYRILQERYRAIPELAGVEVLAGFNPVGNPVFQKLVQQSALTEGQYVSVWKAYFLSLVGNWLLEIAGENHSDRFRTLNSLLTETGLRSKDDAPDTIFSKIINTIQRAINPQSAEVEFSLSETGIPIVIPRVKFGEEKKGGTKEVPHEQALRLLNDCLREIDLTTWIALDRLDEAFQGFPNIEIPALRALLRSYLDLLEFDRLRLKLFVRRDLFRKVIGEGFVNLTHINARKIEVSWDEADLQNLLARRISDNADFVKSIGAEGLSDERLFYRLFPDKIDQAERKPTTWNWMMSRIRDGNDVKPPRNFIDLANLARREQIRADQRQARTIQPNAPLILADAIRRAHEKLSEQRVEDTLLAESARDVSKLIAKFRKAKAEHNLQSLQDLLDLKGDALQSAIRQLKEVGFLEQLPATWKVPMLYRDGLEVRQGKAFAGDAAEDADE